MAQFKFSDLSTKLISDLPDDRLHLIICIPCFNEPDISSAILSILDCTGIDACVEVIILINQGLDCSSFISARNEKTYQECINFSNSNECSSIRIYPLYVSNIPDKLAGVGFARRLAMDEAHQRLISVKKNRGIIACLDADTTVEPNYLHELIAYFRTQIKSEACSIAFEHDLDIDDGSIKSAICDYESHLRYFINMQRVIGLPFAYQTVGSAMAVTAQSYKKLGGMNTRKAGEDFYFMHKFIKNGLVGDLNSTCVYPSPRISDRVPFGTGKAVGEIVNGDKNYLTYNPQSFFVIEGLIASIDSLYNSDGLNHFNSLSLDATLVTYLEKEDFGQRLIELKSNTSSFKSFKKRFFQWFDAFRLMKCLHYLRDNAYPNVEIEEATDLLFQKLDLGAHESKYMNLELLRMFDRDSDF